MSGTTSAPSADAHAATEANAKALLENFKRLWRDMDPRIVEEIVAPDATAFWSGRGTFDGSEYPEQMRVAMQSILDAKMDVTTHAIDLPYLYISWILRGTYLGASLEVRGIDRFRLRGALADDVWAIFDTGIMRERLAGLQKRQRARRS
jgi:hypothetical protein